MEYKVRRYTNCIWFFINPYIKGPFQMKKKQKWSWEGVIMLIINNERKIWTHHEIIDCTADKIVSVIAQMCKETKLRNHPTLQRLNFSFTYSLKFTYVDLIYRYKDLRKKNSVKETKNNWQPLTLHQKIKIYEALIKLHMRFKNCRVNFRSEWYLLESWFS